MISRQTLTHPFNRGKYLIGEPTPPHYGNATPVGAGPASLQANVVPVPTAIVAQLAEIADAVFTDREDVVLRTRDWWARTMIAETSGNPATPDAVFVEVHTAEQVRQVVKICFDASIPVTASAGRSNVIGGALPIHGGVVLDLCGLNKIRSFDATSQIVDVEAGMFGDLFEAELQEQHKQTTGHWPSAFAISTIGGWIACRGAGQLSTRYGKIEDMVIGIDVVLADGSLVTYGDYPRAATGPDLRQVFIGSEGTLGIITAARIRTHRLPEYASARAFGFESFDAGLDACRRIMQRGCTPAVLRLYDKLESGVHFGLPNTNVLLIADEGDPAIIDAMMSVSVEECESGQGPHAAIPLDSDAIFERWLDERMVTGKSSEGFSHGPGFVADTLEIAGTWTALPAIYDAVVSAIESVPGTLAASAHQSHAYTDGACIYFSLRGDVEPENRADWYREVWSAANNALIANNAALSHHHGCGLLRGPYLSRSLGAAFQTFVDIKDLLDPRGILNPGKLGLPSPFGAGPLD